MNNMNRKKSEKIELPVNYKGKIFNSNQKPFITTYLLETNEKIPLVIICPGGGYEHLSSRESEPIAKKMNELGFSAVVLNYSLAPMEFPAALCDLAETVALVRKNAEQWKVDTNKIVVCGFSAGGHLAASLGCYWKHGLLQGILPYKAEQIRPNFMLLCYPVITAEQGICHEGSIQNVLGKNNLDNFDLRDFVSLEKNVDSTFPPTFIWHTTEDESVPLENSLEMAKALRNSKIKFEYHIFQKGCHGLALATSETAKEDGTCQEKECAVWIDLFKNWFDEQ